MPFIRISTSCPKIYLHLFLLALLSLINRSCEATQPLRLGVARSCRFRCGDAAKWSRKRVPLTRRRCGLWAGTVSWVGGIKGSSVRADVRARGTSWSRFPGDCGCEAFATALANGKDAFSPSRRVWRFFFFFLFNDKIIHGSPPSSKHGVPQWG